MKQTAYLWSGIVICAVLIVVVLFKINSLENKVRLLGEPNGSALNIGVGQQLTLTKKRPDQISIDQKRKGGEQWLK